MEALVKSRTSVGRPNPNAKRKFFIECPFSSFKIVQDLDKHSKPCFPYTPVIEGSKKRRGITQQTAIIIFDLRLVKMRSLLFGKNIIIHLKVEIEWSFNCKEMINYLNVHFWWPVMFIRAFCISSINIKDIGFLFYIALSFGNWIYANTRMCIIIKLSAGLPIHGHCQKV